MMKSNMLLKPAVGLEKVLKSVDQVSDTPMDRRGFMIGGLAALAGFYLGRAEEAEAQILDENGVPGNHPAISGYVGSAPYLNDYITTDLIIWYMLLNESEEDHLKLTTNYQGVNLDKGGDSLSRIAREKMNVGKHEVKIEYYGPQGNIHADPLSRTYFAIIKLNNKEIRLEYEGINKGKGGDEATRLTRIYTKTDSVKIDLNLKGSGKNYSDDSFSRITEVEGKIKNLRINLAYNGTGHKGDDSFSRIKNIISDDGTTDLQLFGTGNQNEADHLSRITRIQGRFLDYTVDISYDGAGLGKGGDDFSRPYQASGLFTKIKNDDEEKQGK